MTGKETTQAMRETRHEPEQPMVVATGLAVRRDRGAGGANLRTGRGPAPHG